MTAHSPIFETEGATYGDFKVVKSFPIPELQCRLVELVHLPTNAQVMHLANEDSENLFCLSFQTRPSKSDGVAHILEHTVLCGSKKYPVKDPFFAMTRRSLNTFMNALTGADFTCYPASTQVTKDFYNLLEVYLDAVFHPNLDRLSFLQEGHRLEFANAADAKSLLEHKGVVFNEMKGVLASPSSRMSEAIHEAMYPDLTYGINSGGNPAVIPKLTYEELKAFHETYYHPSRCLFFFYGNLPLERHLDFISEKALKGVKKLDPLPPIPAQPRFLKPRHILSSYPIAPEEDTADKAMISFGWLTCPIGDQEELLALSILEIILMDTDASILKKTLLRSGLCKLASSHIDLDNSEIPWMINCRGCKPENAEPLERLIFDTLEEYVKQGISPHLVEIAIHQLEFFRSEITGDHYPFGLSLFFRSGLLKQHNVAPEEGLKVHSLFKELRHKCKDEPGYLERLVRKHLLDNKHFVQVVMVPDKELGGKELAEERAGLDKIKSELTKEESWALVHQAEELKNFQKRQEEEDVEVLPKVTLHDVPVDSVTYPLQRDRVGNVELFHHETFTNGIVYADLAYEIPDLTVEELPYVNLFNILLPQMGARGRNYAENLEYIQENTGGFRAGASLYLQANNNTLMKPALHLHGRALHRKAEKLFPLIKDFAEAVDFTDMSRLKEVMTKHFAAMESNLTQNAMKYAINLAASGLDAPSKVAQEWHGLNYYLKIRELVHNLDKNLKPLADKLIALKDKLLCLENPHLIVTCDAGMLRQLKENGFYGIGDIKTHSHTPWKGNFTPDETGRQGRIISSPVAFIGKVMKTVPYSDPSSAALGVAAGLFDNLVLHTLIREQGGAYGGGATSNALSGNFYFYSFRDPNIASTLKAFDKAIEEIIDGNFDEQDVEEAKLEIIQGLDYPLAPGSRGIQSYSWFREGKVPEVRHQFRERLLAVNNKDVIDVVIRHLAPRIADAPVAVFAGTELLNRENDVLAHSHYPRLVVRGI